MMTATDHQRDAKIKRLRANGEPPAKIAKKFGVSASRISQIAPQRKAPPPRKVMPKTKAAAKSTNERSSHVSGGIQTVQIKVPLTEQQVAEIKRRQVEVPLEVEHVSGEVLSEAPEKQDLHVRNISRELINLMLDSVGEALEHQDDNERLTYLLDTLIMKCAQMKLRL